MNDIFDEFATEIEFDEYIDNIIINSKYGVIVKNIILKECLEEAKKKKYVSIINKIRKEILKLKEVKYDCIEIIHEINLKETYIQLAKFIKNNDSIIELLNIINLTNAITKEIAVDNLMCVVNNSSTYIFTSGVVNDNNEMVCTLNPLTKNDMEKETKNFQKHLYYNSTYLIEICGKIISIFLNEYIETHRNNIEMDIQEIINNTYFINEEMYDAYFKAFKFALIDYDFETSFQKLVPYLLERSVKNICKINEINYMKYSNDDEKTNTLGYLIKELNKNNIISDDDCFILMVLFEGEGGYNLRNEISHGLMSVDSFYGLHVWFAIVYIMNLCVKFKK